MKLMFSTANASNIKSAALVYFMPDNNGSTKEITKTITDHFPASHTLFASGDIASAKKNPIVIYNSAEAKSKRLIIAGLGENDIPLLEKYRRAAAQATRKAQSLKCSSLYFHLPKIDSESAADLAQAIVVGATLALYKFDKYISDDDHKQTGIVKSIGLFCDNRAWLNAGKRGAELGQIIAEGVTISRDLANAPNNEIFPESLGKRAVASGKSAGFKTTVFSHKKIQSLNMNGLLAVNQGSARPPAFIVMEYKGGKRSEKPVVIVGKGVTFDTGGISLKPGAGMADMKMDMHGSATVVGAMYAVAKAGLPINLIGLIPSTDNHPDGAAYVPGDIITYSNGVSVEVDNTDAEGRLILADALIYAARYKPQAVIDLATLTGACVIALGHVASGLMGTDQDLKERIKAAGSRTCEYVCELPLYEEYEEQIKSDVADVKNNGGRAAGSITAGLFLKRFIGNYPWAHIDIAGTAMSPRETPINPKGGTGYGVRLLFETLRSWKDA